MSQLDSHAIARLVDWVRASRHLVILSGAGMSTESGLPDMRSPEPSELKDRLLAGMETLYREDPAAHAAFYRMAIEGVLAHGPHEGHRVLARWERGREVTIVTQNVDGYHQTAGSTRVIELHGSVRDVVCSRCRATTTAESYLASADYHCACGGERKPDLVLFGDSLPEGAVNAALAATAGADLFIVLGSSLTVSPANMLPMIAAKARANLVIINRGDTELDELADLKLEASIRETLETVDQALNENAPAR